MFDAVTKELDVLKNELSALREKFSDAGKKAFSAALKLFMDAHPEVQAIRWQQYTPYFNDGDACVFGIYEPEVSLAPASAEEDVDEDDSYDDDEEFQDTWSLGYYCNGSARKGAVPPEVKKLQDDLQSLYSIMQDAEDAMEEAFGDHVEVTYRRGAAEVEVDEYSHD